MPPSISAMANYPSNSNSQSQLAEINIMQRNRSNQNLNSQSPKKLPPPNVGDYSTNIIRKNPPRNNRISNAQKLYSINTNSDRNAYRYNKPVY